MKRSNAKPKQLRNHFRQSIENRFLTIILKNVYFFDEYFHPQPAISFLSSFLQTVEWHICAKHLSLFNSLVLQCKYCICAS